MRRLVLVFLASLLAGCSASVPTTLSFQNREYRVVEVNEVVGEGTGVLSALEAVAVGRTAPSSLDGENLVVVGLAESCRLPLALNKIGPANFVWPSRLIAYVVHEGRSLTWPAPESPPEEYLSDLDILAEARNQPTDIDRVLAELQQCESEHNTWTSFPVIAVFGRVVQARMASRVGPRVMNIFVVDHVMHLRNQSHAETLAESLIDGAIDELRDRAVQGASPN